jgi:hypothetical protein
MTVKTEAAWSTESELKYIANIGAGMGASLSKIPRLVFLQGYLQGFNRRERWDNIHKSVVLRTLKAEIKQAGGR